VNVGRKRKEEENENGNGRSGRGKESKKEKDQALKTIKAIKENREVEITGTGEAGGRGLRYLAYMEGRCSHCFGEIGGEGIEELYQVKGLTFTRRYHLTLSTAEAGRFLHTAPSALRDTSVSAFIPSLLRGYLQGLCHQPVNGLHKRHYLLSRPYIHVYVPSARTTPHLSRPGALFELLDIQATSKELMED
jgi:hypothetical protein